LEEAHERPIPTVGSEAVLTAVFVHLTGPGMRLRCRAFGARLLAVLALVLPVPVFAVLGLSLPLPATVERLAARLVPFGSVETGSDAVALGGSIILAPGEQRSEQISTEPDGSLASVPRGAELSSAVITGPRGASPSAQTEAGASAPGGGGRSTTPTGGAPTNSAPSSSTSSGSPSPAPTSDDTQSGGGSEPAEPSLVDTVETTANDAVNTATTAVTDTVGPPAETAKGVVDSTEDAVKGVLGTVP
jgi:hypothetical protein